MGERGAILRGLSKSHRDLILAHGFPLQGLQEALEAVRERESPADVRCTGYEIEHLLGELARSINHCRSETLALRLNEVYEEIEPQERRI